MTAPRAIILDCAGPALPPDERAFLRDADPWGFILFARHVETPEQVARLCGELRDAVGRDAPVLIDQEGGRVARLKPPHWREWPWMSAMRAGLAPEAMDEALRWRFRLIARELRALGVDVDCMPMADLPVAGAHRIVTDRALGDTAEAVGRRARIVADALLAGGVLPVLKHLPGHGRAFADSHAALPRVRASLEALRETDFAAFRPVADLPLGMTAHVAFDALGGDAATVSPEAIRAIREEIGFDGLLMTDDLAMEALGGGMGARARASLAAGCDALLLCNADRAAQAEALAETPELAGAALARAEAALAARRPPEPFDEAEAEARHARIVKALADA
ncbi:MAG TPA: glycoside hydrolase family 3 N-terminal domain-containing protein [Paracoccaceae bacterium]|nr:glycoside hydrolase family 3 N-terminal domain-containing protein [Paracoccaceae bacterium]